MAMPVEDSSSTINFGEIAQLDHPLDQKFPAMIKLAIQFMTPSHASSSKHLTAHFGSFNSPLLF
jgi:hypothetical protein